MVEELDKSQTDDNQSHIPENSNSKSVKFGEISMQGEFTPKAHKLQIDETKSVSNVEPSPSVTPSHQYSRPTSADLIE